MGRKVIAFVFLSFEFLISRRIARNASRQVIRSHILAIRINNFNFLYEFPQFCNAYGLIGRLKVD